MSDWCAPREKCPRGKKVALVFLVVLAQFLISKHYSIQSCQNLTRTTKKKPQMRRLEHAVAACLLIMDDTERLKEWIAYHWTVLPLQHLVIAIDTKSSNDSLERIHDIVDEWRPHGLSIEPWFNNSFIEDKERRNAIAADMNSGRKFATTQNHFVNSCMRHHKTKNNATWTLLTDTDEHVLFNYIHESSENPEYYDLILSWKPKSETDEERIRNAPIRWQLPPLQNTTIGSFLHNHSDFFTKPCIRIPDLKFGNDESELHRIQHGLTKDTLGAIDPTKVTTLRHRKHTALRRGDFSKVMIDVSRVDERFFHPRHAKNIHNPNLQACGWNGNSNSGTDYIAAPFRINHYLGTKEQFLERARDYRGHNLDSYNKRYEDWGPYQPEGDDDIRVWVDAFVEHAGPEGASELLGQRSPT